MAKDGLNTSSGWELFITVKFCIIARQTQHKINKINSGLIGISYD